MISKILKFFGFGLTYNEEIYIAANKINNIAKRHRKNLLISVDDISFILKQYYFDIDRLQEEYENYNTR